MKEELKVKKWGGENAAELTKSPQNIIKDFKLGIKQVVVVSAVRSSKFNTTDKLIELGKLLSQKNIDLEEVKDKLGEIKDFHLEVAENKGNKYIKDIIETKFNELLERISTYIDSEKKTIPSKYNDYSISIGKNLISILGFGEIISSEIHALLTNNLSIDGLKAEAVDLVDIAKDIDLSKLESDIFSQLNKRLFERLEVIIKDNKVPIVPGFVSGFEKGIEDAIGRGYSDSTAAMIAVGFSPNYNVVLEIQKSVIGILSADPRVVAGDKIRLIEKLDYLTAKEITGVRGAQAKLLHYQVLRKELQKAGIKLHLFDPFKDTKGTIISREKNKLSSGVEYIGGRENIIVFTVSSGDMTSRGVLLEIFKIVKEYASIDIVSTSETEVSFSIAGIVNILSVDTLEEMASRIRKSLNIKEDGYENFVKYEKNKVLVFCIGQNLSHSLGSLGRAALALSKGGINIEMVSQGTMERAIVFGLQGGTLKDAIKLLHDEFIG